MKNPFKNAVLATGYITLVSLFMFYGQNLIPKEDNVLMPMTMLSLLTFSAALMGYLFFWEPVQMFNEGRKQEAVSFFLKTLGTFALITLLLIILVMIV